MSTDVIEAPIVIEDPKLADFESTVSQFQQQLTPQTELWEDAIDQLTEIFGEYLRGLGVEESKNTTWQREFQQHLENNEPLFIAMVAAIRPRDERGSPTVFDPYNYWANKLARGDAERRQPQPAPASQSGRQGRPTVMSGDPRRD